MYTSKQIMNANDRWGLNNFCFRLPPVLVFFTNSFFQNDTGQMKKKLNGNCYNKDNKNISPSTFF